MAKEDKEKEKENKKEDNAEVKPIRKKINLIKV